MKNKAGRKFEGRTYVYMTFSPKALDKLDAARGRTARGKFIESEWLDKLPDLTGFEQFEMAGGRKK